MKDRFRLDQISHLQFFLLAYSMLPR